ncbi:LysR family transcriptional regulator [Croceitalea rosinachiae]|uniref:LysR family transcriptional regulator n=1 Tax=Croceitalea rosinachiae TaxID=3075596 RepID=A0ABU3A8V9_9FLAO|nr:LysR family transcriptional regulator [Croceitalea sp. F388]MDT0606624.1 LysR family transcriptional regulator [Croceitalea sp. F388]
MNYTLNQLRIFVKVAQNQSITKASEELHLTQPAVSIQLRNFQDQFPIPLTEVVGRRLYLTEFGKEIALASEKVLSEINAINYKTLEYGGNLAGQLKIAVVSTGKYVMPYFLSGFMTKHSKVDLVMDVTNKASVIRSLENNEVDFALVSVLPKHLNIDKVELMENILYLVGSEDSLKIDKKRRLKSLANAPLIFRENGSATRMAMENYLNSKNIKVSKKVELTSNEAVKQAVVAGLGYSIMPLIGIKNELMNDSLKIYNLPGLPIKTNWNLIWMSSKRFSPVAKTFLKYLKEEKESIIQTEFNWFKSYAKKEYG